MYKILINIVLIFFTTLVTSLGYADKIKFGFGLSLPPYVITDPEPFKGVEYDIIKEALAVKGHEMNPVFVPLARVPVAFKDGSVDAVQRDGGTNLSESGGYYSHDTVTYRDALVILKSNKDKIIVNKPEDLKKYRILAYQGASLDPPHLKWLGGVKDDANKYSETAKQVTQVLMLETGRVDIAFGDHNIIRHYVDILKRDPQYKDMRIDDLYFIDVLSPATYQAVFRDPKIRDDFNAGLKHLRDTGRYDEIYKQYGAKVTIIND